MKLYRIFWTNEGAFWRRGPIIIRKPGTKGGKYFIRVIDTQGIANRQETTSERDAFRRGNAWYRKLKKQPK